MPTGGPSVPNGNVRFGNIMTGAIHQNRHIETLKSRFEKNTGRHKGIDWMAVQTKLEANPRKLEVQKLGEVDLKTSSWVKTPPNIRKLGGALSCDRRYGQVCLYHYGAES